MTRLYDRTMDDSSRPVDSYWEAARHNLPAPRAQPLSRTETCDVAIIGGGYCGLSAAYHLAARGADVRVLEAGDIGWGASGRNGGFCSIGASFLDAAALVSMHGRDETERFYRALVESVRLVEALAGEEGFNIGRQGDGVWTFAHKPSRVADLQLQAEMLGRVGVRAEVLGAEAFRERAFDCAEQSGALFEHVGFGLHPLAFCLGLARAAERKGAVLHPHSRVIRRGKQDGLHILRTAAGEIRARKVVVATNGWMPEDLFPELAGRVLPIMSNIIVTEALQPSVLAEQSWRTDAPASNTRNHLSYLRMLPENRLLFGGRGDTTGRPSGLARMRRLLERRRDRLFPSLAASPVSHAWRGFIAATRRLTPAVGTLPSDPSVGFAFGCHGNGVAFMTWAGRALALLMSGEDAGLPSVVRGLPEKFPLPALRVWGLRAMLVRAHVEDEWF